MALENGDEMLRSYIVNKFEELDSKFENTK